MPFSFSRYSIIAINSAFMEVLEMAAYREQKKWAVNPLSSDRVCVVFGEVSGRIYMRQANDAPLPGLFREG
jgi:hypothetical protein